MASMLRRTFSLSLFLTAALALVPGIGTAGSKDYAGNLKDNAVNVIDTTTGAVVATIAVSRDGKSAYVTSEGSNDVSVIDLATGKTATVAVRQPPRRIAVQGRARTRGIPADEDFATYMN